ncbi:Immune-associated nucleotide-binding protein 9 [Citrus sinensis]|nr:Immune-associated nucleotide-binding protein 9 [Citrus sinensis]
MMHVDMDPDTQYIKICTTTGNSILGRRAFKSKVGSSEDTKTCEMQRTMLKDGQVVNVIDTPAIARLFDSSADFEFVSKEIVKCIGMAKDGIHAVLIVFSVRNRFSEEEGAAIHSLESLFGKKVFDYMIVVFTRGDELEDNDETLEDYLGPECPKPLKEILQLCDNRRVLFDNKTKDAAKRTEQVGKLLSLVDFMILATKLRDQQVEVDSLKGYSKREISELKEQMKKSYEDQLKRSIEMVESKLKETTTRLEQQLAEEHLARLKAEGAAQLAQIKSNEEIFNLREKLERGQRETEELRNGVPKLQCPIL